MKYTYQYYEALATLYREPDQDPIKQQALAEALDELTETERDWVLALARTDPKQAGLN